MNPLPHLPLSRLSTAATRHPSWLPALSTAASANHRRLAQLTHAHIITSGAAADRFLANNLITTYSKCGLLGDARHLFDRMPHRDSISWNALLSAYALHNLPAAAFDHFGLMRRSTSPPTRLTFTPLLKLCSASPDLLPTSQTIHSYSIAIGLDSDTLLSSALINVYSKFGLLDDGRYLFDGMPDRDIVLWNIMIKGYAEKGLADDALDMFSDLHRNGTVRPDENSFWYALMACESGRGFEQVRVFGLKLCLIDECSDVVSWNMIISDFVKYGENRTALDSFVEMWRLNVGHDNATWVIVLSAVVGAYSLELGEEIHGLLLKGGFFSDVSVANSLINMYAKMGSFDCARKVFDEMEEMDMISWNSMISVSLQNGLTGHAIDLFKDLLELGMTPDEFTMASVLRACSGIVGSSSLYEQLHCLAVKQGLSMDNFVLTALIDAYAKRRRLEEALFLFNSMDSLDLASYNALITGYIADGDSYKALELFKSRQWCSGKPDDYVLATVLKACSALVAFEQGRQIHAHATKLGYGSDLCVNSGIVDMYMKCGNREDAFAAFKENHEPDSVAWTAMISGCVENGDEDDAFSLYHQMRRSRTVPEEFTLASLFKACSSLVLLEQGRQIHADAIKLECASDDFVVTSIMVMYAKCGNIDDSYQLFTKMGKKNIASWNAIVLGLAQHGHGQEALLLFERMRSQNVLPDKITFIGVLSACSHSGLVSEARDYFNLMIRDFDIKPELEHYSCLVDVLGRAGLLGEAEKVMETMPFNASASMCSALLRACRFQKNVDIGERVATRLLALEPNDSSSYLLLSNIYASANRWDDVADVREKMKSKSMIKDPGCSWIEVKNKVHLFTVDDMSHTDTTAIYEELESLIQRIKVEGYVPDRDFTLLDVQEEEKERALYYHSEKLAIAFGLISTSQHQRILVIKNLRICGDCHNAIKYISKVVRREIVLRDASRFHCFRDGTCTCGDFW